MRTMGLSSPHHDVKGTRRQRRKSGQYKALATDPEETVVMLNESFGQGLQDNQEGSREDCEEWVRRVCWRKVLGD